MHEVNWDRLRTMPTALRDVTIVSLVRDSRMSSVDIADGLGISRERVRQIVHRATGAGIKEARGGQRFRPRQDVWDRKDEIVSLAEGGMTQESIASRFGCALSIISNLLRASGFTSPYLETLRQERAAWIPGVQALLDQRYSMDRCAKATGVPLASIQNAVDRGELTCHRKWHEQKYAYDIEEVLRRKAAGESVASIARSLNMPVNTLQMRVKNERHRRERE